ncbi:MAG: adenylate kinase family protein [Candidatus Aenigmarchaeota archaeon]|nr:adenylate kinase family protein [Candidatus Aenigmarchaeota archaeon]
MLIAITGTPGTGKSEVARILAKMLDAKLISISELVGKKKLAYTYDKKRKTKEIAEKDLKKIISLEAEKGIINILEGHLSHLVEADYTFVLRTNPKELEKRLKKRNWSKSKIRENVLAEFIDEIAMEAGTGKTTFELDTSKMKPRKTATLIKDILNSYSLQKKYRTGRIDWTEKYRNVVLKMV